MSDNGYIDDQSLIIVHTDVWTQINSARSSLVGTHSSDRCAFTIEPYKVVRTLSLLIEISLDVRTENNLTADLLLFFTRSSILLKL